MWEAELAVRHYGCPVSDVSAANPDVYVENVSKVRLEGGRAKRLLEVYGEPGAIRGFVDEFRRHRRTKSCEWLSASDASPVYLACELTYATDNPSVMSLVHENGLFSHSDVAVKDGVEHWILYTQSKAEIRSLVDSLEALDNNVELARNVDIAPITGGEAIQFASLRTLLTDGQVRVLKAALELGYYDSDTDATLQDVADYLGLHRSTVGEHVKKAEETLITEIGTRIFSTKPLPTP